MLNLPRITGWGTDVIAKTLMEKSDENRRREEEKTKMIGNAILQQAQSGNFTEEGFELVKKQFGPEVAGVFRKTAEQVTQQNTMKLANMRQEKLLTSLKMRSEDLNLLEKLEKLGDTETAKMIIEKWNEFSKIAGTNAPISPLMDAVVRKEQIEKTTTAILNKSITQAEKEPTIESLSQARTDLTASVKNMNKDIAALYGKRIDAAEDRLKKKTEREEDLKTKIAEESRRKQAEIDKEDRAATAPTPDIKNYQFAKGHGYKGSFQEWKAGNKTETGTLTEASVVTQFDNFALDKGTPELRGQMYNEYLQLRKSKMPREDAFNKVLQKYGLPEVPKPAPIKPNQKDLSSLWR